ncbi:hypothetical protein IX315_000997 [Porphyromonas levii]|nr:hypothetical protein [Porphyromonas levii]MBR8770407.1 hypothetical protein [Porphyromonas levii]MBR8803346.1 hypothetical protein [Porphyromonas levii]
MNAEKRVLGYPKPIYVGNIARRQFVATNCACPLRGNKP